MMVLEPAMVIAARLWRKLFKVLDKVLYSLLALYSAVVLEYGRETRKWNAGCASSRSLLTPAAFVATLTGILGGNPRAWSFEAQLTFLRAEEVLTDPEVTYLRGPGVTWAVVWRSCFAAFGLWAEEGDHPEIPPQPDLQGASYRDARIVAILTGLASMTDDARAIPSAASFHAFADRLCRGDYRRLPCRESGYAREMLRGIPRTRRNARAFASVRNGTYRLPEKFLAEFVRDGWKLNLSGEPVNGSLHSGTTTGVTCRKAKTIFLYNADEGTWYHEFAHFIMYRTHLEMLLEFLFRKEKGEATRRILGDYSQKNAAEYFAEAFAFWMTPRRAELRRASPRTARFLEQAVLGSDDLISWEAAWAIVMAD